MFANEALVSSAPIFAEGIVIERDSAGRSAWIRFDEDTEPSESKVTLTRSTTRAQVGERVLIAGAHEDQLYAIDVLACCEENVDLAAVDSTPIASDGAKAIAVNNNDGGRCLQIRAADDQLLVEYDPVSKQTVIFSQANTRISVDKGSLDLTAADEINLVSRSVKMAALEDVSFSCGNQSIGEHSTFKVKPGHVRLRTTALDIRAKRADTKIAKLQSQGDAVDVDFDEIRLRGSMLSIATGTLVQQADNVYQTVKGLIQCLAGRTRTRVDSTVHVSSQKAFLRADDDFKIDGDQIHLG